MLFLFRKFLSPILPLIEVSSCYNLSFLLSFFFSFFLSFSLLTTSILDNMGLICNQVESTLKDEVNNNEDKQLTSDSLSNSPKRRRKLVKQSTHRNFLYTLFKWYFKSRSLQDEAEISLENINTLNCNDDDSSLAYRNRQKNPHQARSSSPKTSPNTPSPSSSNYLSHSHYLVRQSICLYAASSVILALCYLATPSSATTENPSHPV